MAQQRRHQSRRRRRGRFGGLYRFFAALAVMAAVVAACVVFFRINTVTVEGNSRYTAEEVIEASGIVEGDNLIALSKSKIASAIRMKLPYVESVSIRRKLPDGVLLTVRERVAVASVDSDSGRWLISSQGKVLEEAGDQPVVTVKGLKAINPYAGGNLEVEEADANTLDHVLNLLEALEAQDMLSDSRVLDCSPSTYLTLSWDIYTIKFPRGGDYSYLLRFVRSALASEDMPKNEPGTIDLTVKEGELYFKREH